MVKKCENLVIFPIFSCRLAGKLWSSILLSSLLLLLLSLDNVYPLASYECEWHNFFDQSYMLDLVQTFSNLFCSIIHVQTCSNFFKLVQAYSNLSKLVLTCSNLFKLVPKFSNLVKSFPNMFNSVQTFSDCLNFFNLVQTCSNLSKLVQTCSKVVQSCQKLSKPV